MIKTIKTERAGLVHVYEHCLRRPYLELTVPDDALAITKASFLTMSRGQGFRGDNDSFSWYEVALRRPGGRSDIAPLKIHYNRGGTVQQYATHLYAQTATPRIAFWLGQIRPGDVIELVPKAHFQAWLNIVFGARIEIEYQPRPAADDGLPSFGTLDISQDKSTASLVYQHLRSEDQQIRVLVVESGSADAHVHARFECGPPSETVPISIEAEGQTNRVQVGVSQTLHRAICRLRDPKEPLRTWIDALCINQDDLEERASQVSIMGSIYTRAKRVHVWLDNHVLGIDAGFRLIRDVFNFRHGICGGGNQSELLEDISHRHDDQFCFTREIYQEHQKLALWDLEAEEAGGGEGDSYFTHFCQTFFHHPWFQRVWVIQEAILSPKTILYSRTQSILWEELLAVNDIITTDEFAEGERFGIQTRHSMPSVWPSLARAYDQYQVGGQPREQAMLPILDVFLRGLGSKATDPRDKLFAVLPFGRETHVTDKIPAPLRPDYTKPLENVMADFTRWWILEYGSLDILSSIHCQQNRAWRRTLCDQDPRLTSPIANPSWTITGEGNQQLLHHNLREQFPKALLTGNKMDAETPPDRDLVRSSAPLELSLRGRKIGEIITLNHPTKEMIFPHVDTAYSTDEEDDNDNGDNGNNNKDGHENGGDQDDKITIRTVFHRMFDPTARTGVWLLQGINYRDDPISDTANRDAEDAKRLRFHVQAHHGYDTHAPKQHLYQPSSFPDLEPVESTGMPACMERCLFTLDSGLCGLCPWSAREGDIVVLLDGAKVPFLLRPVAAARTGGKEVEAGEGYLAAELLRTGGLN
ncbi:putative heterokaryon incompatibility protein [Podospora aff. communis PSN243]|uniref:Heterokaryon incompatibility protein n=1 Tax=Podospora aff. communis PSN243 TaxID=3040156 RepID=A0AAV9GMX2_9PEZI|nr:putative heterokaryon incompatibility protein [Podospora aff. communis PSN243]